MSAKILHPIFAAALIYLIASVPSHAAVPAAPCSEYKIAVESGSEIATPVVPDRLLTSWEDALQCLVPIIGALSPSVTAPKFSPAAQSKFLSATGAIRGLMTRASASDEKLKTIMLNQIIQRFRELDDLNVTSVLTYGARSDNFDMRLNSVVILGNVIDNSTVCVPLAHLNDPALASADYGINGRANLLSIISVVAPWAYKQNFNSIKDTRKAINDAIPKNEPSLKQTYLILENIEKRLEVQTDANNKSVNMQPEWVSDCKKYIDAYRPELRDRKNLNY
jgi:hypothetical protein